jgi:ABC-type nitrate/sulfonate/bicarbonate transport system substrate-binding protein
MPVEAFAQPVHSSALLRLGFVPLIDAAPLIAALELGFFAEEGLHVRLERQIGWGNVRDKLTYGHLDAAHALIGMPLLSVLGANWFAEPLVAVMNLGSGGDAITLSGRLAQAEITSAGLLAEWLHRSARRGRPVLAHVFSCSMHHYLLRDWLASAGIDPDVDVSLAVLPPAQMASHMAKEHLDGFCVGEPWNTLAETEGSGAIVLATTEQLPAHPEKSLVVSRRWAAENHSLLPALIRAVLRACLFCDKESNYPALALMLAGRQYLDVSAEVIESSLNLGRTLIQRRSRRRQPTSDWHLRDMSPRSTFPSGTYHLWLMGEMARWQHRSPPNDPVATATQCIDTGPYRAAAAALGIECPSDDFPPMRLRSGWLKAETFSFFNQADPAAVPEGALI